jgi:hypothetical protein
VRTLLAAVARYREAHPEAPRVGIGDLSRPNGGVFDERYGGLGHASHQNGLDVDVYYPRADGTERRAYKPALVDRRLAQALVTPSSPPARSTSSSAPGSDCTDPAGSSRLCARTTTTSTSGSARGEQARRRRHRRRPAGRDRLRRWPGRCSATAPAC